MKASDLHLFAPLEMNPTGGAIHLNDRRLLLWNADVFSGLRQELIESLGVDSARPILKRFGFTNGLRAAGMTENLMEWDNDAEWWTSCPALQRHDGKAPPDVHSLLVDREQGVFELEAQWSDSYEAEQHVRIFGTSPSPVCWTLAGFASGFATAMMGEECLVIETECVAMGAERCRVVGKTRRAWGRPGQAFAFDDYRCREKISNGEAEDFVLRSRCMEEVLDLCHSAARLDASVIFSGERGAGKSKLARLLHSASARRANTFVSVNCAALPETLLNSELFGHVKGAFIGATEDKIGALEAARDGTLFLQDVQSLPLGTQSKLLRALNEREVWPIGSKEPRTMHARVIAATHVDLDQQVRDRDFQHDLLQLLRAVSVHVEPLRSRPEDLLPLSKAFLSQLCQRAGCNEKSISVAAAEALSLHPWPGNLRELENVLERALMLCGDGHVIEREHLISILGSEQGQVEGDSVEIMPIAEIERRYVLQVLDRYKGNRTKTAKALGIGANTLWRKLKGWGVPPARGDTSYPQSCSPLD